MERLRWLLVCAVLSVAPAYQGAAQSDEVILRPMARGEKPPAPPMRPQARPEDRPEIAHGAQTRAQMRAEQNLFAFDPNALRTSFRPNRRPAVIEAKAEEARVARVRGQVCGDPDIQGTTLGTVPGPGSCGVTDAVEVRSVAGIPLTTRAVIDCTTARALKSWVESTAQPAVADIGGGLGSLKVIGGYTCRNRNGATAGRISEHAFGRAIDIGGVVLKNGRELSVLRDWGNGDAGQRLRRMHRNACGTFGTVLGPNANAAHRDHFHFDTARYRSGNYCR